MDIADQMKGEGFEIDKKKIVLDEPIKRLGTYSVTVRIHPEVTAQVGVEVVEE
jgi:large subunit ribosomal protein L9